eukprot:5624587-Pleurochrysis_carterae.AAC.7
MILKSLPNTSWVVPAREQPQQSTILIYDSSQHISYHKHRSRAIVQKQILVTGSHLLLACCGITRRQLAMGQNVNENMVFKIRDI